MNFLPQNLRDLVNDAISKGLRGRVVDALVCASGVNWLDPAKPMPFLSIKVLPAAFECLQDGKTGILGMNWVPRFVSIYPPRSGEFPIARVYQFSVPDLIEFAQIARSFEERGFGLKPMFPDEFEMAIEAKGHEERIIDYCEEFRERAKEFRGLVDGRITATCIEQGVIFGSKGCMRCGRDAGIVSTTLTGADGGEGLMMGFYLCLEHAKEAYAGNLFRYFFRTLGAPVYMATGAVSFEFLVDAAVDFLKTQLGCRIEKVFDRTVRKGKPGRSREKEITKRIVVTAVRPSGFRVIVRLQDDSKYAYMVQNAAGIELARVDNTADHDVPFGPDHLHLSPIEDSKNVVPSFTYGLPQMDARIIRRILEEHGG